MTRKMKRNKYICYCLILLLCNLLQNIRGLSLELNGARCFILLPAAIILAMGEDEIIGGFLGLFAGLLWDLTSSVHMGFNSIFIALLCFLASALITYIVRNIFITNLIASAVTIILYGLIYWLIFIIIKGVDGGEMTLFTFYIPSMLYTIAITPIVYALLKPVKKKFLPEEKVAIDLEK